MKCSIPAAFSSSEHDGLPAITTMHLSFRLLYISGAAVAYSSSELQMTTISGSASIAALIPDSTESKPLLSVILYPPHAKNPVENCALAFLIKGFPTGRRNTCGFLPDD